ncbi:unnamed protein product [Camellia sinensis]
MATSEDSDTRGGMSSDNVKGLVLALSSSFFIGASFIVKKKGLKKAGASGTRAGVGGYSYLYEPLWWAGMITMIVGEIANFAAYAFAPAILVTPLGALSIIISAALAHIILGERLHIFGILGCVLCVVGSITIVLHAPQEREIESVKEVWDLATEPGFLVYAALVIASAFIIIIYFIPQYGQTYIIAYIGVCSLVGSLTVMSVRALGIALKLTFSGINQLLYPQTWVFAIVVISCVLTQLNYLNKALDTFNTAVVSPIYYVMFTTLTIVASVIMFKDWAHQNPTQITTELCGFLLDHPYLCAFISIQKRMELNLKVSLFGAKTHHDHHENLFFDSSTIFHYPQTCLLIGGKDITAVNLYVVERLVYPSFEIFPKVQEIRALLIREVENKPKL